MRLLATVLARQQESDQSFVELGLVLVLIVVVATLSLLFLGDAVADLISLIGGHVDDATLAD